MYCYSFCELENGLINANKKYDESIVSLYFLKGLDRAKSMNDCNNSKKVYMRIYSNLINSMSDLLIPVAWREQCYIHLKIMMPLLSNILSFSDFSFKQNEVLTLRNYFLHTTKKEALNVATSFEFSTNGIIKR